MIENGTGGVNTQTGKFFEIETDLITNLTNANIDISNITFCKQHDFPRLLKSKGFDMKKHFGKKFLPDEAFIYNNHLYIIEKKYQQVNGSVDEKIQTGPYKKLVFDECATALGLNGCTYIYLLSESFNVEKYTLHQIPYLRNQGIQVYFSKIPIQTIFF